MTDRADTIGFSQARRGWASDADKRSAEWGERTARSLWENLYAPWIDAVDGRAFLDVGCAWGYLFQYMLERHRPAKLVGVDVIAHWDGSPFDWRAEERAAVELHAGDVFSAPLADESFDYVLCAGMLMYLPPTALHATLRRMYRLLRPGGQLLLRTQVFTSYLGLQMHRSYELPYVHMLHGEQMLAERLESRGRRRPPFSSWLTATTYLTAFLDAGFEVLDERRSANRHAPGVQERVLAEFPASREEMSVNQLAARLVRPIEREELERIHAP